MPYLDLTLAVVTLILLSGFCSLAEAAVVAINTLKVKVLSRGNPDQFSALLSIVDSRERHISSILILNTTVNIVISSIIGGIIISYYDSIGQAVFTAILTLSVLLFAEIIPKLIASQHPEETLKKLAPFLYIIVLVLRPLLYIVDFLTSKILGAKTDSLITLSDVKYLVKLAKKNGLINKGQSFLVYRILEKKEVSAEALMIPMDNVQYLVGDQKIKDVKDEALQMEHRRILVVERSLTPKIVGVVHRSKIFSNVLTGNDDLLVGDIVESTVNISKESSVIEVLDKINRTNCYMAIVTENDIPVGIITLEDILGEIIN